MDETTWLTCENPEPMLAYLEGKCSNRKLRLFACACCRAIGELITDPLCCQAVESAESHADGNLSAEEMDAIHEAAQNGKPLFADASWAAAWSAAPNALQAAEEASLHAATSLARLAAEKSKSLAWAAVRSGATEDDKTAAWARYDTEREAATSDYRRELASLLREIVGNPFRPLEIVPCPLTVIELARSLYEGDDCAFALADALEEASQVKLAEHFRPEGWHPRGCWAMDVILGRE
jgi:hypothetical protein